MSSKPIYRYKDYVDKKKILINQEPGYRYSLFVPFKESINDKCVLVIMRNPSEADKSKSDKTINNVLSFCHDKYSGVYIGNLYPYYETDSKKVKDFIESDLYDEKMKKNHLALESLSKDIDDVVIAWGTNNTGHKYDDYYESIVKELLDELYKDNKNVYAMRFVSSKNPWHPRNWEENFELELYKWSK
jgi:hypothetical protein